VQFGFTFPTDCIRLPDLWVSHMTFINLILETLAFQLTATDEHFDQAIGA
jgi:hypothetical protein